MGTDQKIYFFPFQFFLTEFIREVNFFNHIGIMNQISFTTVSIVFPELFLSYMKTDYLNT